MILRETRSSYFSPTAADRLESVSDLRRIATTRGTSRSFLSRLRFTGLLLNEGMFFQNLVGAVYDRARTLGLQTVRGL